MYVDEQHGHTDVLFEIMMYIFNFNPRKCYLLKGMDMKFQNFIPEYFSGVLRDFFVESDDGNRNSD